MLSSLGPSLVSGLLLGGVYAAMSVGFSLAMGSAHTLNLSHTAIALVCTYLAYFGMRLYHVDPVLSLVVLAPAMFAFGLAMYRGLIRPTVTRSKDPVMATAVLTLGLSVIIENALSLAWTPNAKLITTPYSGKAVNLAGIPVQISHLIAFAVSAACVTAIYVFLHKTTTGKAIQAIAQNEEGARLQGIQVARTSALCFAIGTATASVGGVCAALLFAFTPVSYFEWLLWVFLVVMVAGVGAIRGTLFTGLIFGAVIGIIGALIPNVWLNLVLFGCLIITLLVRPTGLFRT